MHHYISVVPNDYHLIRCPNLLSLIKYNKLILKNHEELNLENTESLLICVYNFLKNSKFHNMYMRVAGLQQISRSLGHMEPCNR